MQFYSFAAAAALVSFEAFAATPGPFPKTCADARVLKAAVEMATTQATYDEDQGLGEFAGGPTSLGARVTFFAPNGSIVAYGSRDARQVEVGSKLPLDAKVDFNLICGFRKARSSSTLTPLVLTATKKTAKSGVAPTIYTAPYDPQGGVTVLIAIAKSRQAADLNATFIK
jgi:hypothetical protein